MLHSPFHYLTIVFLVLLLEPGALSFKIPSIRSPFRDINLKIVGGLIGNVKIFPYQVSIFTINSHPKPNLEVGELCGGSIANEEWIITAAHCVVNDKKVPANPSDIEVRFGVNRLDELTPEIVDNKTIVAKEVHVHPEYDDEVFYNDIALIRLSKKVAYKKNEIEAACFDLTDRKVDYLIASGYGMVSPQIEDSEGNVTKKGERGNELKYAFFKENPDQEDCNNDYFICIAQYDDKSIDSVCMGDSGGPLTTPDKKVKGCSSNISGRTINGDDVIFCKDNDQTRYTRFSRHIEFIDKFVGKSNYCWTRPRIIEQAPVAQPLTTASTY